MSATCDVLESAAGSTTATGVVDDCWSAGGLRKIEIQVVQRHGLRNQIGHVRGREGERQRLQEGRAGGLEHERRPHGQF
eukprot:764477-Hanusia_phi.AAC.1